MALACLLSSMKVTMLSELAFIIYAIEYLTMNHALRWPCKQAFEGLEEAFVVLAKREPHPGRPVERWRAWCRLGSGGGSAERP